MYAQASDNSHVLSNASDGDVHADETTRPDSTCRAATCDIVCPWGMPTCNPPSNQQCVTAAVLPTHDKRQTPRFLDALRKLSRVGPKEKTRCILPFSIECNMYNRNVSGPQQQVETCIEGHVGMDVSSHSCQAYFCAQAAYFVHGTDATLQPFGRILYFCAQAAYFDSHF